MRILSLDLERYGPFTGTRLTFRPDARLHVVLGPNEAGKSSALSAVTDLLFGIEERTKLDFLHAGAELRLGAEIVARDGRRLAFRRRKGRKRQLVDARDEAMAEDALVPFLGGLSRAVFCHAFGLDSATLRAGGKEMLKSDGEVGATLFAAASGLRGYKDVERALASEAAAIYAPRAHQRTLNVALARYEEARAAIKTTRLGPEAWRELNDGLDAATGRLDAMTERRAEIAAEAGRLRRLQRVAPILQSLEAQAEAATHYDDLVEMTDEAVDELGARHIAALAAAERLAVARADRERAERDLAEVRVDRTYGVEADAILRLFRGLDDHEKSRRDLPRVEREAEEFSDALDRLAVRIGLPDASGIEARRPSDVTRARIERLMKLGIEVRADLALLERERDGGRQELAASLKARQDRGPLVDPAPVRAMLDALEPVLREMSRRDSLDTEIRLDARALDGATLRLSPPIDLAALCAAPLPASDTVQRFGSELDELERGRARAADRLGTLGRDEREIVARLEARATERPVPERSALLALRAGRDLAWERVRAAAFGEAAAPSGGALAREAAAYERARDAADAMADDLAADAGRAAEQAGDLRRLEALRADIARAAAELEGAVSAEAEAGRRWAALWQPVGIAPHPPAEMAGWLSAASASIARQAALDARRVELAVLTGKIEAVRPSLLAVAARLGLAGLDELDLALVKARVDERLRVVAEAWDTARDGETRLAATEERAVAVEAMLATARERGAAWRGDWGPAIAALYLPDGSEPDEAAAALAAWDKVPAALEGRDNRLGRVTGMGRDMVAYEAEARRLLDALAPDLRLPLAEAVKALHDRLEEAREAETRRAERANRLSATTRSHDEAAAKADEGGRALADALRAAGLPEGEDVARLHRRASERRELRRQLRTSREELARAGGGIDEATLRGELATLSVDEIAARLVGLDEEEARLEGDGKEAYAERSRRMQRRAELEGGTGAEVAAAAKRAAEAEIRAAARRYVVLKLGAMLLAGAIDRHRTGQQDPLVQRAGALFSGLTGGAYIGLAQTYDESDLPLLAGQRSSGGRPVPVDGMSEGTRDQLFLALRLAYLEDFAGRSEPAPFVGDDLFASFDDARTGHGLEALAAIGGQVQPILFTHHEHVARIALARLGGAVDLVELR